MSTNELEIPTPAVTTITEKLPTANINKLTKLSPVPIHILNEIDEEIWLSGSELLTDNSSSSSSSSDSDDINDKNIVKSNKIQIKNIKKKKRVQFSDENTKVKSFKKKINKCENNKELFGVTTLSEKSKVISSKEITSLKDCEILDTDLTDIENWRPKRGSISLPEIITELDKIKLIK